MSVTMEFLSEQGLLFVDSLTTRYTKVGAIAKKNGVLSAKRNVFIDHIPSSEQIGKQFHRLLNLSKKHGYAEGIAHLYPQTLEYLKVHLQTLQKHDIELVKLSDVLSSGSTYAYHSNTKSQSQPISPAPTFQSSMKSKSR
jgi:polysaccharide deacetylase 2 family uncharacterized protein YibQ